MKQNVLKTREKKVVTMDIGAFRAKETVLQSQEDRRIYTCQDLKALAPHRCTFGYDVIVYVGYALFFHCRSFHAAGMNLTDTLKMSLVFTYYTGDNNPISRTRSARLPGIPLTQG